MNKLSSSVISFQLQISHCNLPKDINSHLKDKIGKTACHMYHPWGTFQLLYQLLITDIEDELVTLTATRCARADQGTLYIILCMYRISQECNRGMLHVTRDAELKYKPIQVMLMGTLASPPCNDACCNFKLRDTKS